MDGKICFVKMGSVEYIVSILNSFDANIHEMENTYEMVKNCYLPFLDVSLTRNANNTVTSAYCKTTTNDLYLNWSSLAPTSWKRRTLKTLTDGAYLICSSPEHWKQEIQHLKQVFHEKNDYQKWAINWVVEEVQAKH